MGSQPFFKVPKITTKYFNQPKNHYHKKISKKSLPKILFLHNDILNNSHRSKDFFGKFRSDFSKKNPYHGSDFFEKISPAKFKNSPANNFGVRARLRTPDINISLSPADKLGKYQI